MDPSKNGNGPVASGSGSGKRPRSLSLDSNTIQVDWDSILGSSDPTNSKSNGSDSSVKPGPSGSRTTKRRRNKSPLQGSDSASSTGDELNLTSPTQTASSGSEPGQTSLRHQIDGEGDESADEVLLLVGKQRKRGARPKPNVVGAIPHNQDSEPENSDDVILHPAPGPEGSFALPQRAGVEPEANHIGDISRYPKAEHNNDIPFLTSSSSTALTPPQRTSLEPESILHNAPGPSSKSPSPAAQKLPPQPEPDVLSEYTCPICFSPPANACFLPACGHVMCGACLFMSVKSSIKRAAHAGVGASCPVCRADIPGWDGVGGGVVGMNLRVVLTLDV